MNRNLRQLAKTSGSKSYSSEWRQEAQLCGTVKGGGGQKEVIRRQVRLETFTILKWNRKCSLSHIASLAVEKKCQFCSRIVHRKLRDLGFKRDGARGYEEDGDKKGRRKERVKWCSERKDWGVDEHWCKWLSSDKTQVVEITNDNVFTLMKDDEWTIRLGI